MLKSEKHSISSYRTNHIPLLCGFSGVWEMCVYCQCQHSKSSLQSSPCIHLHKVRAANFPLHTNTHLTPVCANINTHAQKKKKKTRSCSLHTINRQNVSDNKALGRANSRFSPVGLCDCIQVKPSPAGTLAFYFPQIPNSIKTNTEHRRREKKQADGREAIQEQRSGWRWQTDMATARSFALGEKPLITLNIHPHTLCRPIIIYQFLSQSPSSRVWKVQDAAWERCELVTYKNITSPFRGLVEKWDRASLPLHGNTLSIKLESYRGAHTHVHAQPFTKP